MFGVENGNSGWLAGWFLGGEVIRGLCHRVINLVGQVLGRVSQRAPSSTSSVGLRGMITAKGLAFFISMHCIYVFSKSMP